MGLLQYGSEDQQYDFAGGLDPIPEDAAGSNALDIYHPLSRTQRQFIYELVTFHNLNKITSLSTFLTYRR